LSKPARDIEIDGVQVPAGTTFKDFTEKYVTQKVEQQLADSVVSTRGYMKYATPQATQTPQTGGASGEF
jgi:hypothetical protein